MTDWEVGVFSSWTKESAAWLEAGEKRKAFVVGDCAQEAPKNTFFFQAPTPIHQALAMQKVGQLSAFSQVHIFSPELEQVLHAKLHAEMRLSDVADLGVKRVSHLLQNGRLHLSSLRSIAGAFQGIPAVIIGAGPSLLELGDALKKLKGKALLISAGSGLKLSPVAPDLAYITDPHVPLDRSCYPKVPLCIQGRVHPDTLASPPDTIFYVPDSYPPLEGWLMGDETPFDGGWNGANGAYEVAHLLGCGPIYLAGVDLCREEAPVEFEGKKTQRDWVLAIEWFRQREVYNLSQKGVQVGPFSAPPNPTAPCPPFPQGKPVRLRPEKLAAWRDALETKSELARALLFDPIWNLWEPLFEREESDLGIQKRLFLDRITKEHLDVLKEEKRTFYPSGQLKTVQRFFGGLREGETALYWPNGKLKRRVTFKKGERQEGEEFWDET